MIWSQVGIIQATRAVAPNAWRRHLHLLLDAFRAECAHDCPTPLTPQQFVQTLTTLESLPKRSAASAATRHEPRLTTSRNAAYDVVQRGMQR